MEIQGCHSSFHFSIMLPLVKVLCNIVSFVVKAFWADECFPFHSLTSLSHCFHGHRFQKTGRLEFAIQSWKEKQGGIRCIPSSHLLIPSCRSFTMKQFPLDKTFIISIWLEVCPLLPLRVASKLKPLVGPCLWSVSFTVLVHQWSDSRWNVL